MVNKVVCIQFFGNWDNLIKIKHSFVSVCRTEGFSLMVSVLLMIVILIWINWVQSKVLQEIKDFSF